MSGGNDSGLDTTVTDNSVPESGVTSGMFQPTYISGRYPGNDTEEVIGIYCAKYCVLDCPPITSPAGAVKEEMKALLSLDSGDRVPGALLPRGYHITSHGGSVCFALPTCPHGDSATASEFKVYMGCNSLEEQTEETTAFLTPRLDHGKPFCILLLYMRIDNNGQDYKILVGGRYHEGDSYTFVFDSKRPHEWLRIPEGPLFVADYVQGGAIYKPAHTSEFLLCISTLDDVRNTQISSYNFMMKKWSILKKPQISQALLGIEECGGIIFLFSQAKIDEDVFFFIHKLIGVSNANNASWEEITCRKRVSACKTDFYIFPDTKSDPSGITIDICGGCLFVFNLTSGTDGSHVSIHDWTVDVNGVGKWGPKINVEDEPLIRHRAPNWRDDEDRAFKTFEEQAAQKKLTGTPKWVYISENLRKQSGVYRSPKQCQDRGDTIRRTRANPVAGRSTRRKDTMVSPSTSTPSKRSKSLTDAHGSSLSTTPLIRDSTSTIIHPSDVRPHEPLASPAHYQGCGKSGKSEKRTSDYLRCVEAFEGIEKPLTNDQETELFQKIVDLNILKARAGIPVQPCSKLSEFLGHLPRLARSTKRDCKLFEWLMQHLEMDRLEIDNRVPATSDAVTNNHTLGL